jgi:hypothetical protein
MAQPDCNVQRTPARSNPDEGVLLQKLCELLDLPLRQTLNIVAEVETAELHIDVRFDVGTRAPWAILSKEGA